MIIPSIDLRGGQTVQLVGGKRLALEAGDPLRIAENFRLVGEIAVVDLDAALGTGTNENLVRQLIAIAPCRVGGGIRTVEAARHWLDLGATQVVLGTAARPEILRGLPRERVIAALDAEDDEVVVKGWTERTGRRIAERMAELRDLVGGFLVTFVELEGQMKGTDLERAKLLKAAAGSARLTIAGGVTSPEEVAALDALDADAQVGMALYTGRMSLADAFAAPLRSDRPDGLWPTVVCDELGTCLGLVYSSRESLRESLATRRGVYQSRTRGLWRKGESSGDIQDLVRIDTDCDRDALRFTVHQRGRGFCHRATRTCFGPDSGLGELARRLSKRRDNAPPGSYTRRLLDDPALLQAKLVEEAGELATAQGSAAVAGEAADLIYFAWVALARAGVPLSEVTRVLDLRALKLTRRAGDRKQSEEEA